MDKKNCILKMLDLYFSKFSFINNKNNEKTNLKIEYNTEIMLNNKNENIVKVVIDTNISSENSSILLSLQTIGIFEIDDSIKDDGIKEQVLNRNTIAIMFPFIRSQISLLTTQPGMIPIMLQPIDVNLLEIKQK